MKDWMILVLIGVVMGALAGLLVVTFNFSPIRTTLLVILAAVTLFDIVLLGLAYKKGRLRARYL